MGEFEVPWVAEEGTKGPVRHSWGRGLEVAGVLLLKKCRIGPGTGQLIELPRKGGVDPAHLLIDQP